MALLPGVGWSTSAAGAEVPGTIEEPTPPKASSSPFVSIPTRVIAQLWLVVPNPSKPEVIDQRGR